MVEKIKNDKNQNKLLLMYAENRKNTPAFIALDSNAIGNWHNPDRCRIMLSNIVTLCCSISYAAIFFPIHNNLFVRLFYFFFSFYFSSFALSQLTNLLMQNIGETDSYFKRGNWSATNRNCSCEYILIILYVIKISLCLHFSYFRW